MISSIPPLNTLGKDTTAYWENFLTDNELNQILAEPEWLQTAPGAIGGSGGNGEVVPELRNSRISWLNLKDSNRHIWEKITYVIAEVNRNFFQFELTGCYEPFQLSTYNSLNTEHYTWHTDMSMADSGIPRKLSMSLLLSDIGEFQGGELQVKTGSDIPITLECKKGRAWFFPSWTLHRVTPVTNGVRRSLVCWVGGPQFR